MNGGMLAHWASSRNILSLWGIPLSYLFSFMTYDQITDTAAKLIARPRIFIKEIVILFLKFLIKIFNIPCKSMAIS
jgi:hypothetical protein